MKKISFFYTVRRFIAVSVRLRSAERSRPARRLCDNRSVGNRSKRRLRNAYKGAVRRARCFARRELRIYAYERRNGENYRHRNQTCFRLENSRRQRREVRDYADRGAG